MGQVTGTGRYVHVARTFDELTQNAKGGIRIPEAMASQDLFPFGPRALELAGERGFGLDVAGFGFEKFIERGADVATMGLVGSRERFKRWKSHQSREAFLVRMARGDGMGLQIVLHLKA